MLAAVLVEVYRFRVGSTLQVVGLKLMSEIYLSPC